MQTRIVENYKGSLVLALQNPTLSYNKRSLYMKTMTIMGCQQLFGPLSDLYVFCHFSPAVLTVTETTKMLSTEALKNRSVRVSRCFLLKT